MVAVVFVHGSGAHDRDETIGPNAPLRDLAIGLAARGIASLRYEKRTREWSLRFIAKLPNWTVDDEVIDDAVASIALLAQRPEISGVFVVGHSLGAMLAPRIAHRAAAQGTPLRGVVLLAGPLTPLHRLVVDQYEFLATQPGRGVTPEMIADIRVRRDNVEQLLRSPAHTPAPGPLPFDWPVSAWLDFGNYDPAATLLAQPALPALLLFGGRDFQVPIREKGLWEARLGMRPNTTLREFSSLNHLLIAGEGAPSAEEYSRPGRVSDPLLDAVADWVQQTSVERSAALR